MPYSTTSVEKLRTPKNPTTDFSGIAKQEKSDKNSINALFSQRILLKKPECVSKHLRPPSNILSLTGGADWGCSQLFSVPTRKFTAFIFRKGKLKTPGDHILRVSLKWARLSLNYPEPFISTANCWNKMRSPTFSQKENTDSAGFRS